MIETEETSPTAELARIKYRQAVAPSILPVLPETWLSLRGMGIDLDQGHRMWIDDGTHVWDAFREHWGWWKTQITGWYPYTSERDYYLHERSGEGRPWLRLLPERWQEIVFRELVLLIDDWNRAVVPEARYLFRVGEIEPGWLAHWLALTNEVYERGADEFKREIAEQIPEGGDVAGNVWRLSEQYLASQATWRPMMPAQAVYHRRYGARGEYWSFER